MVLQETWLKSATIRENITYGCPGAAEEDIIRAAKKGARPQFHYASPEGYDTVIGEEGGQPFPGTEAAAVHCPCYAAGFLLC